MFKKIKIYIFKFYHSFQMKRLFIMKSHFVGVVYFFSLFTIFGALRIIFESFSGFFRLKKMITFSHLRKVDESFEEFQKICPSKKILDPPLLVVPTFDTEVTEYLCSGWVFFSSDKFRLFN